MINKTATISVTNTVAGPKKHRDDGNTRAFKKFVD